MDSADMDIDQAWLTPTWFIDSDHPRIERYATEACDGADDPTEMAVRLFHRVRDGLRYDPFGNENSPEAFKASVIADDSTSWCVPKSVLLTAAARNRGIPARLGFADVKNHLTSDKLRERMGSDLFIWHGYSELLLDGRWFKLSSAFNIELCQRFGVKVLEFDGTDDALMHPFDESGNQHMEYLNQRGTYDDLPLDEMQADFRRLYSSWYDGGATSAAEAGDEAFS